MPSIASSPRILTIQSHVVSGYCGNKSATFPLQLLEFEVDVVNTVQLSNHTRYKVAKGQIFSSKDLEKIHEGLKENQLLTLYDQVISGYVADISYIISMAKLIEEVKATRRLKQMDCLYTFDPVLGDDGVGYYVPGAEKAAEAYKKYLLPLADIITPNRFEASILSGVEIDTSSPEAMTQSVRAINELHRLGLQVVVITSLSLSSDPSSLTCIVSHRPTTSSCIITNEDPRRQDIWTIRIPKLACPFTGTGDLFASLFSAWLHKSTFNLKLALENTANSIHEILEDTLEYFNSVGDRSVQSHELRLVQNKASIMSPRSRFKAELYEIHKDA